MPWLISQAFNQAWAEIASHFGGDPSVTDAAGIALATAILSVAIDDSRDVEALKQAGLQAMARNYKLPISRRKSRTGNNPGAVLFSYGES
jgi:hypothetical protein